MSQIFYSLLQYAADNLPAADWRELTPNVRPALLATANEFDKQYAFDYLRAVLSMD